MFRQVKRFIAFAAVFTLIGGTTAMAAPGGSSFFSEPPPQQGLYSHWSGRDEVWNGYKIIPKVDITITAVGRDASGMENSHEVAVWDMSNRPDPGVTWGGDDQVESRGWGDKSPMMAKVTVSPSSSQDSGFYYETLDTPIVLKAGGLYGIASREYIGGDPVTNSSINNTVIGDLINNDIAYVCEDAHDGIPYDENASIGAPTNYWHSDWEVKDGVSVRGGGNVGILGSVNIWYTVGVPAEPDPGPADSGSSGGDSGSGGKDVPVTGDNSLNIAVFAVIFLAAGCGAFALKKRRVEI